MKMLEQYEEVLPENRGLVVQYLDSESMASISHILTSVVTADAADSDVVDLARTHMEISEEKLTHVLEATKYEIDSADTMKVLFGASSFEKVSIKTTLVFIFKHFPQYIFPLLYLVLTHHYNLLRLARKEVLDEREIRGAEVTLSSIISLLESRMESLKG